jgi:hypothetical protein
MRDVEVTAEMKWIEVGEKAHSGVVWCKKNVVNLNVT